MSEDQQSVALVTGTSSGMGLHASVGLARKGLRVVATMRNLERSADLLTAARRAGVEVATERLDVIDEDNVRRCVDAVLDQHGRIDVLVNNAGQGMVGTLERLGMGDLRAQMEVNYFGVAHLTAMVLPAMRAAGAGRIVTVTSVGGAVGQPFADAYCGAKFAVEGLMQSLAPVVARFGIEISVVEPGAVASEFVTNARTDDLPADDPYAPLLQAYIARSEATFENAQSSEDAAGVIVEAATTSEPRFRWQTSTTAAAFAGLSLADLDGSSVIDQTRTWIEPR